MVGSGACEQMDQPGTKEAILGEGRRVQKAETGHSGVRWANGPGGVLAQEEGRLMEAGGPGGRLRGSHGEVVLF